MLAISSQSEAPTIASLVLALNSAYPDLVYFGPYCERLNGIGFVTGPEAYELKVEHALAQGLAIMKQRGHLDKAAASAQAIVDNDQNDGTGRVLAPSTKLIIPQA